MTVVDLLARAGAPRELGYAIIWLVVGMCLLAVRRARRFAMSLAVLLLAAQLKTRWSEKELLALRTFFGIHRVTFDPENGRNELRHGTTLHGIQEVGGPDAQVPRLYYHPTGPIGAVFASLDGETGETGAKVAIVGLGVGSLAAYGREDRQITFYEIDAAIIRVARDEGYFTYLAASRSPIRYVVGDARQELQRETEDRYRMMIIDVFHSDSIPIHLITEQAVALYLSKLIPGGVLVVRVSNRHLDLVPIVGAIGRALSLVTYVNAEHRADSSDAQILAGKTSSTWIALAKSEDSLRAIAARDPRWRRYDPPKFTDLLALIERVDGAPSPRAAAASAYCAAMDDLPVPGAPIRTALVPRSRPPSRSAWSFSTTSRRRLDP